MPRTYRVPSVERAFQLLEEVGRAPNGMTFAEIVEQTGIPKTTAFMLVSALRELGVIAQHEAHYTLGPMLAKLGGQALRRLDLRTVAIPYMQRLVEQTAFTAHLGVLSGQDLVFIDKVESDRFIQFLTYPGMTQPFYLSSLGKAVAAFLPETEFETLVAQCHFVRKTNYTISDAETFRQVAVTIRKQGYATEDEENEEGVRCIGAPIFDRDGRVAAAVSVTAVRSHLPMEAFPRIAALVIAAANGISLQLGCSHPPIAAVGGGAGD